MTLAPTPNCGHWALFWVLIIPQLLTLYNVTYTSSFSLSLPWKLRTTWAQLSHSWLFLALGRHFFCPLRLQWGGETPGPCTGPCFYLRPAQTWAAQKPEQWLTLAIPWQETPYCARFMLIKCTFMGLKEDTINSSPHSKRRLFLLTHSFEGIDCCSAEEGQIDHTAVVYQSRYFD